MTMQGELEFDERQAVTSDCDKLHEMLHYRGWLTRRDLRELTGWTSRYIRALAESSGAAIVRGQRGFKLTEDIKREDFADAIQAADAAISQGKRMIRYGLALKRKLHKILT